MTSKTKRGILQNISLALMLVLCFSIIVFIVSAFLSGIIENKLILDMSIIALRAMKISAGGIIIIIMGRFIKFLLYSSLEKS